MKKLLVCCLFAASVAFAGDPEEWRTVRVQSGTVAVTNTLTVSASGAAVSVTNGPTVAVTNTPNVFVTGGDNTNAVIRGTDGTAVGVDSTSAALKTIGTLETRAQSGRAYTHCQITDDAADDATQDIVISNGAVSIHLTFIAHSEAAAQAFFYEAPQFTNETSTATPVNMDRTSTNVTDVTAFQSPGVTNVGTVLTALVVGGGSDNNGSAGTGERNEFILQTETLYLIRVTNKGGANKDLSVCVTYYEERD